MVLSIGDVAGDHGFGVGIEADPSHAVGKARPCDKLSGLLVHNHDTHLRVIDLERSRGEAVDERAETRGRDSRRPTRCGTGGPSHEPSKL
jgi:hypothetical protein